MTTLLGLLPWWLLQVPLVGQGHLVGGIHTCEIIGRNWLFAYGSRLGKSKIWRAGGGRAAKSEYN